MERWGSKLCCYGQSTAKHDGRVKIGVDFFVNRNTYIKLIKLAILYISTIVQFDQVR